MLGFRILWAGLLGAAVLGGAGQAMATPPPPGVSEMIAAAAGDPAALKTVAGVAKKANPNSIAEIDAQVAALTARAEAVKTERAASLGYFEGWTGKGELGLYRHTGNTDDSGISVKIGVDRDGLRWRHSLDVLADNQRESGVTTKEKYSAAYEGDYKFGRRLYAFGVLYAEKDKFAGIETRFSESVGLGYWLFKGKDLRFNLEAGPALRQTDYLDVPDYDSSDLRLAGEFSWTVWPNTTFTQTAWAYLEERNTTTNSSTALTTKLMLSGVSVRASYDVSHENAPPPGREKTDTTSRLTLVYSF